MQQPPAPPAAPSAGRGSTPDLSPHRTAPPDPPSIVVNHPTPRSATSDEQPPTSARDGEDAMQRSSSSNNGGGGSSSGGGGLRSPGRPPGALEAVQESSLPELPALAGGGGKQSGKRPAGKRPATIAENLTKDTPPGTASTVASGPRTGGSTATTSGTSVAPTSGPTTAGLASNESGSESGRDKGGSAPAPRRASVATASQPPSVSKPAPPATLNPRKSFTHLGTSKNKIASEGSRKMTVDTETVSTVPQNAVGGSKDGGAAGAASRNNEGLQSGSVRLKPSSETIRPKKEKKRVVRKAPSMTATGSSKVDAFAAKVASAVDQADSSDSEETFVYESNPPEPLPRPAGHRYHSRTPSATSMASAVVDPARYDKGNHNSIVGKKSMKFANPNSSALINGYAGDGEPAPAGSAAATAAAANLLKHTNGAGGAVRVNSSGTALHHHVGRAGRTGHHPTVLDQEALFAADRGVSGSAGGSSPRGAAPRSAASSRSHFSHFPHTPRTPARFRGGPPTPAAAPPPTSAKSTGGLPYELGEADDERTPLLPTARSPRTRHGRRPAMSHGWRAGRPATPPSYYFAAPPPERDRRNRGGNSWARACGCALLGGVVALAVVALVVALVFCSKPLLHVHVRDLRNVTAADGELVFDLAVHAVNPNLVSITVGDADLSVLARSRHVGTRRWWREHARPTPVPAPSPSPVRRPQPALPMVPLPPAAAAAAATARGLVRAADSVDDGTDPIDDDDPDWDDDDGDPYDRDPHTMSLGQITEFDEPLLFEASPLGYREAASVGEVRLRHPGNGTERGGSDRWEAVIQHPFELIVRGVLKYSIPISGRVRSVTVSGKKMVYPDDADGNGDDDDDYVDGSIGTVGRARRRAGVSSRRGRRGPD